MRIILKMQRPVYTNDHDDKWLFYNEDRKIYFKRRPTASEIAAMGDEYRVFGVFHLENGQSLFLELTKSRDW